MSSASTLEIYTVRSELRRTGSYLILAPNQNLDEVIVDLDGTTEGAAQQNSRNLKPLETNLSMVFP
jgi:hypothetical protein